MSGDVFRDGAVHNSAVHGSALVIGDAGILVRGASGAGKSSLVLRLIAAARAEGRFARLVADDRVVLSLRHGRILMRSPAVTRGLIEIRGGGLAKIEHLDGAVLRLIVNIDPDAPRYPDEETGTALLHAVTVPCLITRPEMGVIAIMHMLSGGFDNTGMTE